MAEKLQRELSNRHIQLIAIGGAIGTAILRRWSNDCINWPSILLTYIIIGFMLFMFMRGLGEIIIQNTEFKSFRCNQYIHWAFCRIRNRLDILVLLDYYRYG